MSSVVVRFKQFSGVIVTVGFIVALALTLVACNQQKKAEFDPQEQAQKAEVPPRAQLPIFWWAEGHPKPRAGGAKTAPLPSSAKKKSLEAIANTPPPRPKKGCNIVGVQRTVRPHLDPIRTCYRKALRTNPNLKGRLDIEIQVDKSGSARFLGVIRDTLGDTNVTRCIFNILKPLAYPIPKTKRCVVIYPFTFSAGPVKAPPSK